jgi:hypothetical protein
MEETSTKNWIMLNFPSSILFRLLLKAAHCIVETPITL